MSSSKRASQTSVLGPLAGALTIAIVVAAAGCSADVTRFSLGGVGTTGAIPVPFASAREPAYGPGPQETALPPTGPQRDHRVARRDYDPPHASRPRDYRVIGRDYGPPPDSLYPLAGRPPRDSRPAPDSQPPLVSRAPRDNRPALASRTPPAPPVPEPEPPASPTLSSETVEVQAGDTLYSIARRHGVPASALKEVNALTSTTVRPGQRLALPGGARERGPSAKRSPPLGDGTGAKFTSAPPASSTSPVAEAPSAWEGRHIVKRGDSLSAIALQHKVSVDELMRVNGITDPTKVWAGTALMVPGPSEPAANPAPALAPRVVQVKPRIIQGPTAKRGDVATDVEPLPAVAGTKFRWPVRGRVIVGFGIQPDGSKNEGINLAAPLGTEIHAAEAGRVHYVGDGLKNYGNLVLIRHADDWATAYGHVDQILVKANDEVKRGQVIARVGRSGPVTQPQLKFELRKASVPVDPLAHLAK